MLRLCPNLCKSIHLPKCLNSHRQATASFSFSISKIRRMGRRNLCLLSPGSSHISLCLSADPQPRMERVHSLSFSHLTHILRSCLRLICKYLLWNQVNETFHLYRLTFLQALDMFSKCAQPPFAEQSYRVRLLQDSYEEMASMNEICEFLIMLKRLPSGSLLFMHKIKWSDSIHTNICIMHTKRQFFL